MRIPFLCRLSSESTLVRVPAISRGLSEATPPVMRWKATRTPEGCQHGSNLDDREPASGYLMETCNAVERCCDPAGVELKLAIRDPGVSLCSTPG
jgi:hypothetical protein